MRGDTKSGSRTGMAAQSINATAESPEKDKGSQIQRAFALLDIVVAENRPLNLAAMAERLGLPKPTVHRIAGRLEAEGFLIREPGGRNYGIGPRLNALAADTLTASAQRAPRHAVLEWLARETGETCNLGVLDGNAVVYLDRVESTWPLRLHFSVGSRVPLHAVAMGKLFMSRMPKLDGAAPDLGKGFPKMRGSYVANDIRSSDLAKKGRTIIMMNAASVTTNANFYRDHYLNQGWQTEMDMPISGGNVHTLRFRNGNKNVSIVINKGEKTIITAQINKEGLF